jgi:predicted ATPase
VGERYPALNLTPQRQKQRTLEVLIEQLVSLARARPVLELYEDVHWVDPSTLELLDPLIERVRTLRVLVIMTFRPEFSPRWSGHAHVTSLPLNRLGRRQGAAIVDQLTGGKSLPGEILEQIVAKTDGVPLFVEELTKTVLESGLLRDAGERYELTGALPPLAIPSSLHDSLMARLDRLAPVREVAQIGAVIGREFSYELLATVADMPTVELGSALDQLVEAELIFRHSSPPGATYSFKHALVQDAAYQSLLKSRRQQLHARIVRAIREHLPDLVEQQPEVVAHHLSEAGMLAEAVVCWRKAAERAARNSAHREATAHASKGVELLRRLPETPERAEQELALQLIRAESSIVTAGYAASIAGQAYGRAAELTAQIGDLKQQFRVLDGYWTYHAVEGNVRRAYEVAQQMAALAAEVDSTDHHVFAYQAMGVTSLFLGEFRRARDYLAEALDASAGMSDQSRARRGGEPQAVCLTMDGLALWATGYPDRGLTRAREALERADAVRHPFTRAFVRGYLALVHDLRREPHGVADAAQAMATIARDDGFGYLLSVAQLRLGAALMAEDRDEGARLLRQGLDGQRATGSTLHLLYGLIVYAETCLAAGWTDEADAAIDEGQQLVRLSTVHWCKAEIHRLTGKLYFVRGATREAEAGFERAIAVARQQHARSFELRAATGLARLWAEQGKRGEARDLLAPTYGWFTEGFDTADLKDAKAFLDQLV